MKYTIARLRAPHAIDAVWNKPAWKTVKSLSLNNSMGDRPDHFPRTRAKVGYDREALYVIFTVEDRYIKALAKQHQDTVCTDSCVEFFFVPGSGTTTGYFNFETNCGGIMLACFQTARNENLVQVSGVDMARITIAHSMPARVDAELTEPRTWTIEYQLPFDILRNYTKPVMPAPGVMWRGNFYKCADKTSHPHWLTWAPVDRPRPDFHRPEFFGTLEFE